MTLTLRLAGHGHTEGLGREGAPRQQSTPIKPPPSLPLASIRAWAQEDSWGRASRKGKNGQKSVVTSQVRRGSVGTNSHETQASKGKVRHMDFQKHCIGVRKRMHFTQLWDEPGAQQKWSGENVLAWDGGKRGEPARKGPLRMGQRI